MLYGVILTVSKPRLLRASAYATPQQALEAAGLGE